VVGLVAGDQIAATFAFGNGVHGTFDSKLAEPAPPGNRSGVGNVAQCGRPDRALAAVDGR